MFRIRRVLDSTSPANAEALRQIQEILASRFPKLARSEITGLPEKLRNPFKLRMQPHLLVAERTPGRVEGFALLLHAPDLGFALLDWLATRKGRVGTGTGTGAALYERVREEALALDARVLVFECLPDDPEKSPDQAIRRENAARLRFYERFGARPLANTAYATPVHEGDTDPPELVIDPLGRPVLPGRDVMRAIVRGLLERKYGALCPPDYVARVVASITDDPVRLRRPRYRKDEAGRAIGRSDRARIPLVVNDRHDIHHVRERGYVEAPVRIRAILRELGPSGMFEQISPRHFADHHIRAVHDSAYLDYLRRACTLIGSGKAVYPYVFPIRNRKRPPKELPLRAGYFGIDTFTPLNAEAWLAARRAVDCTLSAAERVAHGSRIAYALVRPPGHHAERRAFGGFCYLSNAAIAAHYLGRFGRAAILDIDYHHGNGQQDIFYDRADVLTVSIHAQPRIAYPYFSGFAEEVGEGPGRGFNLNLPLPETITAADHGAALDKALARIGRFAPDFLVLALGFDIAKGDPTGSWPLLPADLSRIGHAVGRCGWPVLVVQEGGYRTRTLGLNARRFFEGLVLGSAVAPPRRGRRRRAAKPPSSPPALIVWREDPVAGDVAAVRDLVAAAGVFRPEEVSIAVELVEERLARGAKSSYRFVFAEAGDRLAGWACFGPTPGTDGRFDLYWIVVRGDVRRAGLGRELFARVEAAVRAAGGSRILVETSAADAYAPARAFYRRAGLRRLAVLADFYRAGEAKIVFVKEVTASAAGATGA